MKPSSAKAKGRRFQQQIKALMHKVAPWLGDDDIVSRGMGGGGEDLILSPRAREVFPISSECKNQERLNIWSAMAQTEANAGDHTPVLFITRNRAPAYALVPAEHYLELLSENHLREEIEANRGRD